MRTSYFLALLGVLVLNAPARAQTPDLRQVISGRDYPLTVRVGDLDESWRRFTTGPEAEGNNFLGAMMSVYAAAAGGSRYYTRGQTVRIGSETYIVAYRPAARVNVGEFMQRPQDFPQPVLLTRESELRLSLLNLRSIGSIHDLQPFDLQEETAGAASLREQAQAETSRSNLKQLATALMMYTQDYDEVLPPMPDMPTAKKVLIPYCKSESLFVQPGTQTMYRTNPILSRKKLAHLTAPAQMAVFYEAVPAADGSRNVAFLDGHVSLVSAAEWPEVMRVSKIREDAAVPRTAPAAPPGG